MKITHIALVSLVLLLSFAGIKYSMDLQKVMTLTVNTHGGGSLKETGAGLLQSKSELDIEINEIAQQRADAVKLSEEKRLVMADKGVKCDDAKATLAAKVESLAVAENNVQEAEARLNELNDNYNKAIAELKEGVGERLREFADEENVSVFIDALNTFVQEEQAKLAALKTTLEEREVLRKAIIDRLAVSTTKSKELEATDAKFRAEYARNANEYVIDAINTRWHFVIFTASENSQLIPGDTIPLLAKRGDVALNKLKIQKVNGRQIIASYNPEDVPAGLSIQVGDRVYRQFPIGR